MKKPLKNLLYASLFVSLSLSSALADEHANKLCEKVKEGQHTVANPDNCEAYYFCVAKGDGTYTANPLKCPENQRYDKESARCDWEQSVPCSQQ